MNTLLSRILLSLFVFSAVVSFSQTRGDTPDLIKTESGLEYKILKEGQGKYAKSGDRVWLQYIGWLKNDSIFSSTERTGTIDVFLGQGQVTKGWEEGIRLIREGGNILLKVPPHLAYGNNEVGGIPANSTLFFEMAVLQVDRGSLIEPFNIEGKETLDCGDGLRIIKVQKGSGTLAQKGDNAFVHYTGYINDTLIFDSSKKKGEPVRVTVGTGQVIKGWDMALTHMNEGSKVRAILSSELAYGKEGLSTLVPPNATVYLDLELVKLVPEVEVKQWDIAGKDSIITKSGVKCYIVKAGIGDSIKVKDIVHLNYTGYLPDGAIFDSSVKRNEPFYIPVGVGAVIEGWDEALLYMKKGAKYQLHIPSELGYGKDGSPPKVPENASLILDVEVLDAF